MERSNHNDRRGKLWGAIAVALYFAVWLVFMFTVGFRSEVRQGGGGMLIDFGDSPYAGGSGGGAVEITAPPERHFDIDPGEMTTQDYEDAPAVATPPPRPATPRPERTEPAPERETPPEEPRREIDRRAMFPGTATAGSTGSQGNGTGTGQGSGRQGSPFGIPGGDPEGSVLGNGGKNFDLAGRSLIGSLPQPQYGPNKSGRVAVEITVNNQGRVIRAIHRVQGSTTNDSDLVAAALEAAAKTRFNTVTGDELQTGTITYNFILK